MRKHDYDTDYDKNSGGVDSHRAVDTKIREAGYYNNNAYEEGFASASGVRPETASSGGKIKHPESQDAAEIDSVPKSIEKENPGLADN